jgi:hypothetical protein
MSMNSLPVMKASKDAALSSKVVRAGGLDNG